MITAAQYAKMCEEQDAAELAWGLDKIERLSRRELLHLLDRESDKASTERLRRKVRLWWIKGSISWDTLHRLAITSLALLALVLASTAADASTSCRSHTMGSTVYTKCDDGKPSTPPVSCRTYRVGSTVYTKCN